MPEGFHWAWKFYHVFVTPKSFQNDKKKQNVMRVRLYIFIIVDLEVHKNEECEQEF